MYTTRQQRRQALRKQNKQAVKILKHTPEVAGLESRGMQAALEQPESGKPQLPVFLVSAETLSDFQQSLGIVSDAMLRQNEFDPPPRINVVAVFEPHPFSDTETMEKSCLTWLVKGFPENLYRILCLPPAKNSDEMHQQINEALTVFHEEIMQEVEFTTETTILSPNHLYAALYNRNAVERMPREDRKILGEYALYVNAHNGFRDSERRNTDLLKFPDEALVGGIRKYVEERNSSAKGDARRARAIEQASSESHMNEFINSIQKGGGRSKVKYRYRWLK